MKNNKLLTKALVGGFVLAVLFSFFGFDTLCTDIENKVLRLHVKANSDSDYDQQIKLAVKDKVFTAAGKLTEDCSSMEEAADVIENNLDILVSVANEFLASFEVPYTATGKLDTSFFGTREYGDFTLPAGEYLALRIDLGEAEGENWWCALYPALCTGSAVKYDNFTKTEENIITSTDEEYEIRFRFYEIYRRLADILSEW